MKKHILLISLVFLLCSTFACQKQGKEVAKEPEVNVEADVVAIKALIDEWVQLYNAGDFDKLVSTVYTEDAVIMSPYESIRKGKEAILLGLKKADELNEEHCDSSVVEDMRVSGNLAVVRGTDTGTATPRSGGEAIKYTVKWLGVFERQSNGTWKQKYEIWYENPLPEMPKKEQQD